MSAVWMAWFWSRQCFQLSLQQRSTAEFQSWEHYLMLRIASTCREVEVRKPEERPSKPSVSGNGSLKKPAITMHSSSSLREQPRTVHKSCHSNKELSCLRRESSHLSWSIQRAWWAHHTPQWILVCWSFSCSLRAAIRAKSQSFPTSSPLNIFSSVMQVKESIDGKSLHGLCEKSWPRRVALDSAVFQSGRRFNISDGWLWSQGQQTPRTLRSRMFTQAL